MSENKNFEIKFYSFAQRFDVKRSTADMTKSISLYTLIKNIDILPTFR